jgi:hypothetical protein
MMVLSSVKWEDDPECSEDSKEAPHSFLFQFSRHNLGLTEGRREGERVLDPKHVGSNPVSTT